MDELTVDFLVVGSGGAGLMACLHALDAKPDLNVALAVKGLCGKSGCTRMVQGGYNAVLRSDDSIELHFKDTVEGGAFLNDQELAWRLVTRAPEVVRELEGRYGCYFDRNPDGTIHQKPFAGQSRNRTVHRGDLTGIEIVSRLRDALFARPVRILEEHRAIELLCGVDGAIAGALLLDLRRGRFVVARAKCVLVATGGSATMYRFATPSVEKSGDGLAMCVRAGLPCVDMEMMQFHPTGILAGRASLTGMILEEGLRGAGAHMLNAKGERFMDRYDPVRMERATRDLVARASFFEVEAGRGTPQGGVWLDASPIGARVVARDFPAMVERMALFGRDLTGEPIEVTPTAHFQMGGVRIDAACRTAIPGLLVAGEDAGGVHGANRLGGNGVAESTVFGTIAGETAAAYCQEHGPAGVDEQIVASSAVRAGRFLRAGRPPYSLRRELNELMWKKAGLVRDAVGLAEAAAELQSLAAALETVGVPGAPAYNPGWQAALDLESLLTVAPLIVASAADRIESRGSHFRRDFPERDDRNWLRRVVARQAAGQLALSVEPVAYPRLRPAPVES